MHFSRGLKDPKQLLIMDERIKKFDLANEVVGSDAAG